MKLDAKNILTVLLTGYLGWLGVQIVDLKSDVASIKANISATDSLARSH